MNLPYKISTLLYCFDKEGRVLLIHRERPPNKGLWSPCGGKLLTEKGESPYMCACREAKEELGIETTPSDWHLTGIVSEEAYEGQAHWLMFLFELRRYLESTPPPILEGEFKFFRPEEIQFLPLPQTDREMIWPLFWKHRGGFFAAHCVSLPNGTNIWTVEESISKKVVDNE